MSDVTKDAAEHGRLYDNFSRQASHPHGGSYYDSGFSLQAHTDAHGKLYDLFGVPKDTAGHGARYDEFGWKDMPAIHGQHFDSDFRQPTAHTSGEHGTWFDEFRGGTEVRYMLEGADYEGTVIECGREFATVRSHDGQTHEVGLSQFLSYRSPSLDGCSPTIPASDAEAPSAHDATAHGASGTRGTATGSELPPVVQEVRPGAAPDHKTDLPGGLMDTFTHLKSLAAELDVEKAAPTHACKNCGASYVKQGAQFRRIKSGITDKIGTSSTVGSCSNCGKPAFSHIVAKSVDATETAAQGQPTIKTVGHRNNCPRGGSAPCGASVDGHCSLCNAEVHDHDAIGKSDTGALGIEVPEREHKSTDHHSSQALPGRCPHCGGVLAEVNEKTEQGQPTHKCLGSSLDVLKTLV